MAITVFQWLLLSGLLLSSTLAEAQPVSTDGTAVPKAAPVAFQLQYFSVFTCYQSFKNQPLLSWPEANNNVGKIGGWRFYARDAMSPDTSTPTEINSPDAEKKQPPVLNGISGQGSKQ